MPPVPSGLCTIWEWFVDLRQHHLLQKEFASSGLTAKADMRPWR